VTFERYYAVIFSSVRTSADEGYGETADRMVELAREQPGFLGLDTAREPDGAGVTVSYWRSLADIARWREHAEHRLAQRLGRERWYASYRLRIAEVIEDRDWSVPQP
jgi:heme-degrading monooxygenase HmoA